MNSFKQLAKRGFKALNSNIQYQSLFFKPNYTCLTYAIYRNKLIANSKPIEESSKDILTRIDKADLKELITFLWYSQESGYWTPELSQKSEERLRNRLDVLSEFDLGMLGWVYGSAKAGSEEFWAAYEREVLVRIGDRTMLKGDFARVVNGAAEANSLSATFWARVQKFIIDGVDDFNAENLALLIGGLGLAANNGEKIDKIAVQALRHGLLRNMIDLKPSEGVLVLQGLADLGIEDDQVWNSIIDHFVQAVEKLPSDQIVKGLEAMGRADKGSVKIWRTLGNYAFSNIESLNGAEVANLAWACARVQHGDARFWNGIRIISEGLLSKTDANGVAKLLFALTGVKENEEPFVKNAFKVINNSKALRSLDAKGLSHLLWSLEKNPQLGKENLNEINKIILEKNGEWSEREREEFLLVLNDTQILSNEVRKALESSI